MTGISIFPTLHAGLQALCIFLHRGTRGSRAKAETLMLTVLRVTLFNLLSGAKAKLPILRSATALQSPLLLLKGGNKTTQRRGWWDNVSTNLFYTAEAVHHFLLFCVCMWLFFLKQFDSIDFINCIYFICHKGIGQPKVRGGESTATLSKSNKLNSHVRNIEH